MPHTDKPSLSAAKVKSLLSNGTPVKYPDGRSLYLVVRAPGVGHWIGQYAANGKQATKGLGSAVDVKLADARTKWEAEKAKLRAGIALSPTAPRSARIMPNGIALLPTAPRSARIVPTGTPFADAALDYVTGMAATWRGGATGKYAKLFATDAKAVMPGGRVLGTYTWPELTDDVIEAYVGKMGARAARDTTVRLRSVRRYQETGKLPTRATKATKKHHPSLQYKDLPTFYSALDMMDERARALAFVVLTGVRISDALGHAEKRPAVWSDISDANVWHIPEDRAKNWAEHFVPLTPLMLELLGPRGAPDAPLFKVGYFQVERLARKAFEGFKDKDGVRRPVIHGFRATFRSWAQDADGIEREAAELCLQHKIGDVAEQSYKRSDILGKRRAIMERWGALLTATSERPATAA